MKPSKYPRLRTKVYRGKGGQSWSYYVYDMRGTGKPDVRLGTDYANALAGWHKQAEAAKEVRNAAACKCKECKE